MTQTLTDSELVWQTIQEHLEKKKHEVAQQILYYPPPIPACDAQFNFLLAERARVEQALGHVKTWASEPLAEPEQLSWLNEFLAGSSDFDETAVQKIRTLLTAVTAD